MNLQIKLKLSAWSTSSLIKAKTEGLDWKIIEVDQHINFIGRP